MRTAVYIDGFNLFYWLRSTPYRWIDLGALALNVLAYPGVRHEIVTVKYFTARVSATADDPHKDKRQDTYLRALAASIPTFSAFFGEFRRQRKWMRQALPGGKVGAPIEVWSTEEKGSDVNLAVELMNDVCDDIFDLAVIVSNDSDFARALHAVKRHGKRVGVLVRGDAQVISLRKVSHFQITLREKHLRDALLPRAIHGTRLQIPGKWRSKETAAGIR